MIINAVLAIALVFLSYKLAVNGNDKGKEQDSSEEVVYNNILKRTSIRSYENKTVEKTWTPRVVNSTKHDCHWLS